MAPKGISTNVIFISAVAVIALLAIAWFAAGNLFSAPIWTETLKIKNSTGQYDVITVYRNATDVSSGDLKAFLDTENATLKAAVQRDSQYRPVEYAVMLHDDAERHQINCSLIPMGTSGESTEHAVVAFHAKDNGMLFVDPTAMNVSSGDYPGIDFGRIVFLRDQWVQALPVTGDDGKAIQTREYRNARTVSFSDLQGFLAADNTELDIEGKPGSSVDYALQLHDKAEADGIACAIARIDFVGNIHSIYCNAFPTTDKGIVYIDDSGVMAPDLQLLYRPCDAVVYLRIGSNLGELPMIATGGNLDYGYYQSNIERISPYLNSVNQYMIDKAAFDAEMNDYLERFNANNDSYNQYLAERAQRDTVKAQYFSDYANRTTDWPTLFNWGKALDEKFNAYLYNASQLSVMKRSLDVRQSQLNQQRDSLSSAHENMWLACYPSGIVKEVKVFW